MKNKVLLILCDGMRPDALEILQHPFYLKMKKLGGYSLLAKTVFPSVTLPCHMSLFLSVEPERHGTLTNTYMPQVRPIDGICEHLNKNGKTCSMHYNWEELKDITRPDSMIHTYYTSGHTLPFAVAQNYCVNDCIATLKDLEPDFEFLYLGRPDGEGHDHGWMSKEYMVALNECWDHIEKVYSMFGDTYNVIVTSDHGGHDRTHGFDIPEDMTIPVLTNIPELKTDTVNIMDLAPTISNILGVKPNREWEGKSLI